jgi:hypothetical protein
LNHNKTKFHHLKKLSVVDFMEMDGNLENDLMFPESLEAVYYNNSKLGNNQCIKNLEKRKHIKICCWEDVAYRIVGKKILKV